MNTNREPQPNATLSVLFIHPFYLNIFRNIMETLALRPGLRCACMVDNYWRSAVKADQPRLTYFGFDGKGLESMLRNGRSLSLHDWMGCGRAVAATLRELAPRYRFDVIVGHAALGCTLYLRQAVSSAIISYCEFPSFAYLAARKEFPPTFENYQSEIAYQSIILPSVIHSDLGLVASQHARNMFPRELRAKVRVQTEGFAVHPVPADVRLLREKLGLPTDSLLVGFFGRTLEAVRGFDVFLKIARRLSQERSNIRFLVIGGEQTIYGNELAYIGDTSFKKYALSQSEMNESEVIWRDLLPYHQFLEYISCLDLAILPTFESASNWSFFEAMAAGVPILSSNQSFVPEVMRDGKEGFLFDPYDVDGFTRKALELLDHPEERHRIANNAQKRIEQRFTPKHVADGYERIIREAHLRNTQRPTACTEKAEDAR